jgi:SET domain-containing protein
MGHYTGDIMSNALHNKRQDTLEETNPEEYAQSYHLIYDKDHVLDARWHGNLFRHLNHSCQPNCIAVKRHAYGIQVILIVARQQLMQGEECTLNYGTTRPNPCNCTHCMYARSVTENTHARPAPICIDMLDDDDNDSDDHADHEASVSVNKKRFKYVRSYASLLS